ncbi:MAG TPA: sensor histidine kinase, partial [Polyangiaceae bacterium]|nr:sensor histidine kinase [Polyangiaceae bacterium]
EGRRCSHRSTRVGEDGKAMTMALDMQPRMQGIEDDKVRLSDGIARRAKEPSCIFALLKALNSPDLEMVMQRVVEALPSALTHAELAYAAVTIRGKTCSTVIAERRKLSLRAPIVVSDEEAGVLEIGYVDVFPDGRTPRFESEEHELLVLIANRMGEYLALREAQSQISTYQDHLRCLASELTLTEERQRRTLALAVHDRIGQGLAVAKLKLESLRHVLPSEHQSRLDDVTVLIKQIVHDTRTLTFEISPPVLYELGLKQAVVWLSEHVKRDFGLPVTVRCDEPLSAIGEGVRVMLFRSIQELLTNVVKHANATRATVHLRNELDQICVVVEDDGIGFDVKGLGHRPSTSGGFGLFSIRERIHHLGGKIEVFSVLGEGSRIQVFVPRGDATEPRA